jgi:hypothetical protein
VEVNVTQTDDSIEKASLTYDLLLKAQQEAFVPTVAVER